MYSINLKLILKSFVFLFLFQSCIKDDDDSNLMCYDECTTIKGKVFKDGGEGVKNVEISLHYWYKDKFAYIKRKIGKSITDSNGYYKMVVYLHDSETDRGRGNLELRINNKNLETSLTNDFLKPSEVEQGVNAEYDKYRVDNIVEKESTLEIDYFIPLKSKKSIISLNNFSSTSKNDNFFFSLHVPYGFPNKYVYPIQEERFANSLNNEFNVVTIIGKNTVIVTKRKNGNVENIKKEIEILEKNKNFNISYDY